MKVFFWNCTGIGNELTRHTLKFICVALCPYIPELMVDFSLISSTFWSFLNLHFFLSNVVSFLCIFVFFFFWGCYYFICSLSVYHFDYQFRRLNTSNALNTSNRHPWTFGDFIGLVWMVCLANVDWSVFKHC